MKFFRKKVPLHEVKALIENYEAVIKFRDFPVETDNLEFQLYINHYNAIRRLKQKWGIS